MRPTASDVSPVATAEQLLAPDLGALVARAVVARTCRVLGLRPGEIPNMEVNVRQFVRQLEKDIAALTGAPIAGRVAGEVLRSCSATRVAKHS